MRIGIDARFYGSIGKGLGRYTEKLIEHLENIDDENEYIVFLRKENFEEYQPKNARFKKVLAHYTWYGLSEQILFLFLLYRSRLDLVHFPHFNVPVLYWKKYVVTIHDLILLHYPTRRNSTRGVFFYTFKFLAYRLIIAAAVRQSVHILTVSEFTKKDILLHYPHAAGKVTVTHEAADLFCRYLSSFKEYELFHRLKLIPENVSLERNMTLRDIIHPYLLYVGNAYPHKNLEIILKIAKELPQYFFVLVGKEDYFYKRLREKAEKEKIQNVIFSGYVNDGELNALYRFGFLYLFPSLYEGFGLPPLEAMACGLPVLSSDRGSLPEILGEAALYFDPEKPESLLGKIRVVEASDGVWQTLQEKGYNQVGQYSFESMAEETHRVYTDCIQR